MSRAHLTLDSPISHRPRRLRVSWIRGWAGLFRVSSDVVRRGLDVLGASLLLALASPLLVVRAAAAIAEERRIFDRRIRIGRFRRPFWLIRFAGRTPARSLPTLLNVLRGDMSFAGPRPLSTEEAATIPPDAAVRFAVRPGLVSRHGIKKRTGIAYDGELSSDCEHYWAQTLSGDLGLVARSIPASLFGGSATRPSPPFLDFFGVKIANTSMEEALDWIEARVSSEEGGPAQVAFVNPDCLNIAWGNDAYRACLQAVDRVLPDGVGIHLGCRMLGTPLEANVNGTDLFPRLCARLAQTGHSLYLLGARPGVAAAAGLAMQRLYPGLRIAGAHDGYFGESEERGLLREINASGASVLLVAFGVPRQELWLAKHRDELAPRVRIGVGGLFDFYSGRIRRAPAWLREIGMEWSWRLLQEPGRMWRRYLVGNWVFLYRVWRQSRRAADPPREETA